MGICDEFEDSHKDTTFSMTLLWMDLGWGILFSITSIFTTWALFRSRSCKEVPFFVQIQMLVLVLMVPFSMTYYTLLIIGDQSHV